MEAIGDITASAEVSRVEVDGEVFDTRIQGGVLADGIGGFVSALFTVTPLSIFAQNNGVVRLTYVQFALHYLTRHLDRYHSVCQPNGRAMVLRILDLFRNHWQNFWCFSEQ
ncbi:permease family domain-containing protein [Rhizoctonia solani AG-1 IA]|uniref:Permease family domain-containing protein n=1 Tax=Thanatephorus cucumeris (strain AG1-IA) TaxID=983506 RepID=L8WGT9_THACA|nr:permease family domain-containing protein [Rhizoctonia solani AG-1 IA]